MEDLSPSNDWHYQVGDAKNEAGRSTRFSFVVTPRNHLSPDDSVTFVTYGDMGVHFKTSRVTIDSLAKSSLLENVQFVFHAGYFVTVLPTHPPPS